MRPKFLNGNITTFPAYQVWQSLRCLAWAVARPKFGLSSFFYFFYIQNHPGGVNLVGGVVVIFARSRLVLSHHLRPYVDILTQAIPISIILSQKPLKILFHPFLAMPLVFF